MGKVEDLLEELNAILPGFSSVRYCNCLQNGDDIFYIKHSTPNITVSFSYRDFYKIEERFMDKYSAVLEYLVSKYPIFLYEIDSFTLSTVSVDKRFWKIIGKSKMLNLHYLGGNLISEELYDMEYCSVSVYFGVDRHKYNSIKNGTSEIVRDTLNRLKYKILRLSSNSLGFIQNYIDTSSIEFLSVKGGIHKGTYKSVIEKFNNLILFDNHLRYHLNYINFTITIKNTTSNIDLDILNSLSIMRPERFKQTKRAIN